MKKLSFFTACLFIVCISQAQPGSTTSEGKQKTFNVSIRTLDNKVINGRLFAVNDSQLVLAKSLNAQYPVPAENIKSFTMKRKNSVLKGALIGLGVGALTGIIMGLASGDDPIQQAPANDPWGFGTFTAGLNNAFAMTAGEKALGGGLILGTSGAIFGTIIGAIAKKKFTIGGKKEKFRDLQAELMMRLVKK